MKILIVGNPVDGMHFIGPFNNSEAACAVGEESGADWWITDLKSRADWREELVQQDEAADEPADKVAALKAAQDELSAIADGNPDLVSSKVLDQIAAALEG